MTLEKSGNISSREMRRGRKKSGTAGKKKKKERPRSGRKDVEGRVRLGGETAGLQKKKKETKKKTCEKPAGRNGAGGD